MRVALGCMRLSTDDLPMFFTGAHVGRDPDDLSFWGRGMATTWRVTIEAEEMTRRQVDLSGLTAIDIEIGYDAFL